jgi:tRNA 2-thiouridine synthesizing protein A
MAAMEVGETLEIDASDPAFGRDIRAWSARMGHELLSVGSAKGVITARVRKAPTAAAAAASRAALARDGVSLVVFSGDLDKAMASLIIANGALAMGSKVTLFFTFWGLNLLRKPDAQTPKKSIIDAAFGFMLPKGVGRANRLTNMNFLGVGGRLMRKVMHDKHVDDPAHLLASLVSGGATLVACQMSMDVMGLRREELIDAVEIGGVATFLEAARQSGTTLFI